jgi:hypothetical protein
VQLTQFQLETVASIVLCDNTTNEYLNLNEPQSLHGISIQIVKKMAENIRVHTTTEKIHQYGYHSSQYDTRTIPRCKNTKKWMIRFIDYALNSNEKIDDIELLKKSINAKVSNLVEQDELVSIIKHMLEQSDWTQD